jgi:hypothetical protein
MHDYAIQLARTHGIERFQVRVGLNSRLVVAGTIGSDRRMKCLAVGDTVNLGARLQSGAEPDTGFVSASTARLVKHAYVLNPRGPFELNGTSEPVLAFQVVGRKSVPGPARGIEGLHSPFGGRDLELDQRRHRVEDLRLGRGGIASLVGEAGLGKSRLLAEVRHEAIPASPHRRCFGRPETCATCPRFSCIP